MATVIVRGLGDDSTHESIRWVFADRFGPVKRVDVIKGRGFAFVKFAAEADAKAAVQAGRDTGVEVDGVWASVDVARDKGAKHPSAAAEKPAEKPAEKLSLIHI